MFDSVKWNFAKVSMRANPRVLPLPSSSLPATSLCMPRQFLVGRDGKVISRYLPTTSPSSIEGDIQAALMADAPKDEL